jgi:hypothetical protein
MICALPLLSSELILLATSIPLDFSNLFDVGPLKIKSWRPVVSEGSSRKGERREKRQREGCRHDNRERKIYQSKGSQTMQRNNKVACRQEARKRNSQKRKGKQ